MGLINTALAIIHNGTNNNLVLSKSDRRKVKMTDLPG